MSSRQGTERTSTEKLVFECSLADAPEKVWRALTVPGLLAAWLAPNDFRAEQGARFSFEDRPGKGIECEVLAIEPPRLMRYAWRDGEAERDALDSVVTFELARTTEGGTRLRISHEAWRVSASAAAGRRLTIPVANSNTPSGLRMAA